MVCIIGKQLTCQKLIYKINSTRLKNAGWDLKLPIDEAFRNDELIALADSQMLRWIDELNGVTDAEATAKQIRTEIRRLRKEPSTPQTKRAIKKLYSELNSVQFKPDYMCLVIDKEKDYYRACKGFAINGVRYRRLLGTNGGIKNSTIVFVSERLHDELARRVENDRDPSKELVTAKLEAYKALTCSASIPVSAPKGLLVVNDAETTFFDDIIYLTDEADGEPVMENRYHEQITANASDGFGLILPSLAQKWSDDLHLDYMIAGANTRFSYEKGMVFTFDFIEFAEKIAGTYIVKDAWGNDVDVRTVDLVMTTSMVKLFDSYESCDDYLTKSFDNGYTFCVTKTCPRSLESERNLNYQFIQSYDFDEEDIDELIKPTVDDIRNALGGDWRKMVLFAKGIGLTEKTVQNLPDDFIKAVMIDRRMMSDPFVQSNIVQMIRNRINEAKVGVLKVHGNYSIVSGDPFLLCQSFFGLEKTGLLQAGEIYNKYWADRDVDKLVCFRAPMTCHNNIRAVHPVHSTETEHWYRYMNTCTIFNAWDTAPSALNGMDFDGDLVLLTDNEVLVRKHVQLPTLMCVQRKAKKRISTEEDFIKSNIESFGNEIGETTNWITSMFEVRAGFEKDSEEYKTLTYRIQCGQLYQQNAIDKAKGIVAKPMPRYWHDRKALNKINDDEFKSRNKHILADKKPYFMRYIYPALRKQYNTYIKNTNKKSLREFRLYVDELMDMPYNELSERQLDFLHYYEYLMPVGTNNCIMNIICRKIEDAFSATKIREIRDDTFDYSIMKSGAEYSSRQYYSIKKLYDIYNERVHSYSVMSNIERADRAESAAALTTMNDEFSKECCAVCPDSATLCDILLDICYKNNTTKRFVWNMVGATIIENLLRNKGHLISWPEQSESGDFTYGGREFTIHSAFLEGGDV